MSSAGGSFSDLKRQKVHPKFLHSNSTSHTWVFSAIAELIDNACDPDVNAQQVSISLENDVLYITDDGNGLSGTGLEEMMTLGLCRKETVNGIAPIGQYGNGFKSGSQRIGRDVLVFTQDKSGETMSVGFLSRTFLEDVNASEVIFPLVTWAKEGARIITSVDQAQQSLEVIFRYSPVKSWEDIQGIYERIGDLHRKSGRKGDVWGGTCVMIFNLRRLYDDTDSPTELQVRGRDIVLNALSSGESGSEYRSYRVNQSDNVYVSLDTSLRAYCEVLYLHPRQNIHIQNRRVKLRRFDKELVGTQTDTFRPHLATYPAKIMFGFNERNKELYGLMLYHRNRLIRPYVRVGCQLRSNTDGVGILGVVEADFLHPTHNKQDFNDTAPYRSLKSTLAKKLNEYWQMMLPLVRPRREKSTARGRGGPEMGDDQDGDIDIENLHPKDIDTWVQCSKCGKWRNLHRHVPSEQHDALFEKWTCADNDDDQHNVCDAPEEQDTTANELTLSPAHRMRIAEEKKKKKRERAISQMRQHAKTALKASQDGPNSSAEMRSALAEILGRVKQEQPDMFEQVYQSFVDERKGGAQEEMAAKAEVQARAGAIDSPSAAQRVQEASRGAEEGAHSARVAEQAGKRAAVEAEATGRNGAREEPARALRSARTASKPTQEQLELPPPQNGEVSVDDGAAASPKKRRRVQNGSVAVSSPQQSTPVSTTTRDEDCATVMNVPSELGAVAVQKLCELVQQIVPAAQYRLMLQNAGGDKNTLVMQLDLSTLKPFLEK